MGVYSHNIKEHMLMIVYEVANSQNPLYCQPYYLERARLKYLMIENQ